MTNQNNIHNLSRGVIIDQGHILLCKTLDLPVPFYFLPGGHIEHMESAEQAAVREILEESGAKASIKRFLGCLEHSFKPGHNSICHNHEYNFIFEVESDSLKLGRPIPRMEKHIELLWVPLDKLDEIDFRPKALKTVIHRWLQNAPCITWQSVMVS
jgi:8-oxo-dGTP diphosphatase